jgi:glycosyltransferase involved in cell wall biosynthesis
MKGASAGSRARVLHFALPGRLATRTGGYLYDARIIAGLRDRGWTVRVHELAASFPRPGADDLAGAEARLAGIEDGALLVVDGLALGAMPLLAARLAGRVRLIGLVHHPLALETGIGIAEAERFWRSEEAALAATARVIVTSETTRDVLRGRAVALPSIAAVEPGTARPPRSQRVRGPQDPIALLCVATLTPRKGHRVLFDALARLRDRSWRLACVGSGERDAPHSVALREQVRRLGLVERIRFAGELDAAGVAREYAKADVFVLASFMEGYGMALAEALAHGVPIVATRAGAIPQTVPEQAGVLVEPGDPTALAAALEWLIGDEDHRRSLARGAREAGALLPTWEEAVVRFERELLAVGSAR